MGPTVERPLTQAEMARMPVARQEMMAAGAQGCATRFTFFAAFDGTKNHKNYPERAGDRWQTNIGNLFDQAEEVQGTTLQARCYPGATPADLGVAHVEHPGYHVGNGGGYDAHGTAASWGCCARSRCLRPCRPRRWSTWTRCSASSSEPGRPKPGGPGSTNTPTRC